MTTHHSHDMERQQVSGAAPIHLIFPGLPRNATAEITRTYRHGMSEFEEEMQTLCAQLGFQPVAHHVELDDFAVVLDAIPLGECIFYLCDGNEQDDGVCGITPVLHMERQGRPMISAGSTFWRNTTHKSLMKLLFMEHSVPTPAYRHLTGVHGLADLQELPYPLFAKPDALYGSVGISDRSVLRDDHEVQRHLPALLESYGSLLVEEFVEGREFTVVVLGDGEVFATAERRFDSGLPSWQRFISYERSWVELAGSYPYAAVTSKAERAGLSRVASAAFHAVGGDQYARIDIRQRASSGEFLVLEVNSMPGIGVDSSVGECARVSGKTMLDVLGRILLAG
jgi:D-alanine-D-alanine ligase